MQRRITIFGFIVRFRIRKGSCTLVLPAKVFSFNSYTQTGLILSRLDWIFVYRFPPSLKRRGLEPPQDKGEKRNKRREGGKCAHAAPKENKNIHNPLNMYFSLDLTALVNYILSWKSFGHVSQSFFFSCVSLFPCISFSNVLFPLQSYSFFCLQIIIPQNS